MLACENGLRSFVRSPEMSLLNAILLILFILLNIQLGALFVGTLGSPEATAEAEAAPTADADPDAHLLYYGKHQC